MVLQASTTLISQHLWKEGLET